MERGELLAVGALFLFAANAFVVRAASARLNQGLGFLIALGANVVVAGAAVLIQLLTSGRPLPIDATALWLFLLSGILSTYLGRRGYFRSVQTMGPTRAGAVQATNPVFAVLLAWLLLGQLVVPMDLAAILVVVAGLLLATGFPRGGSPAAAPDPGRIPVRAILPALFSALCYAAGNVARASAMAGWPEPVLGGLLAAVTGTAAYLIVMAPRGGLRGLLTSDRRGVVLWSVAGALTVTGQILIIAATASIPVGVAVAISSALPAVVLPVSLLLLRGAERITLWTGVGVLIVVAGVSVLALT